MAGMGVGAGAGGVLAAEVCAPLLLLCWLCCWPDDDSDTSSGKHPQNPVITTESPSRYRRGRSNELFSRRLGSSAVSLHLPSTSGHTKQPLSAHRSHEEIRSSRKLQQLESNAEDTRYHSAPSVIDEVIHRRDWERSTKDLYIPLKSDNDFSNLSDAEASDRSDIQEQTDEQIVGKPCKKHYTNIKSSKKKDLNKESLNDDVKDKDASENVTNFYIGELSSSPNDNHNEYKENFNEPFENIETEESFNEPNENSKEPNENKFEGKVRGVYKAKDAKQCLNESIRCKDRQRQPLVPLTEFQVAGFDVDNVDAYEVDRSGAMHHTVESRSSLFYPHSIPVPPPSVEAIGYESDASYLEEAGAAGVWRVGGLGGPGGPGVVGGAGGQGVWSRARHASAGDVLAPVLRPQSGALSESELDFELEGCDEPPPAYHEVRLMALDRKETAI